MESHINIDPYPNPSEEISRKYNRETYLKAKELYNKGYSIKEISGMLDIPRPTLHNWILGGMGRKKYALSKEKLH